MRRYRKKEKVEEKKFHDWCKTQKYVCLKLSTVGFYGEAGYNDRLVLAPWRIMLFFEFKMEGEEADPLQNNRHRQLQRMGFETYVVFKASEAIKITLDKVHSQKVSARMLKIRR